MHPENPCGERRFLIAAGWLLIGLLGFADGTRAGEWQDQEFDREVQPFLKTFCAACHGPDQANGGLSMADLDGEFSDEASIVQWESILEQLESGTMPPSEAPQPKAAKRGRVVDRIERRLKQVLAERVDTPRGPIARRLTNLEYEHTIRDLLGFELQLADRLPQDPRQPYRFNNTAEFMRLGPEQVDRYLECARLAMRSAIVDPQPPEVHRSRTTWASTGNDRGLGLDEVGVWGNRRNSAAWGMSINEFPTTGEYRIRVKAASIVPQGGSELPLRLVMGFGLNVNSSTQRIHPVGTVRLTNDVDHPRVFEFRGRIENHPVETGRSHRGKKQPDVLVITPQNLYDDGTLNDDRDFSNTRNIALPRAVIEWIEFESPVVAPWPPEHHTRILFDSPLRERDSTAYVRAVLQRFLDRAYRRPATDGEIARCVAIYDLVSPEFETMEGAMRETLSMVLVSPQFLYHTVATDDATRPYALASKLSYFLWGSMPDRELMELAAAGKLDDPDQLQRQVLRLLADPRSDDFIRNFTTQWLSLDKMKTVPINRDLFPRFLYYVPRGERAGTEVPYRPTIRDFMIEETTGFVGELIHTNASVLNIIDSDFVWINQPLAAHYGMEGVEGIHFRRVPLPQEHRLGGLLTQGSVLVGNGTGTAPHPIYRAVWLREAILGDEVAPPPAEVPALSDSAGESAEQALTIKDLLAKHRQQESCHACHARLDPWGIPFEHFNAIGRYQPRVPEAGMQVAGFRSEVHGDLRGYREYLDSIHTVPVDATSRVPNGPQVHGMSDLKNYLLDDRRDAIIENVLRRLMTYAIGRELETRDRWVIQELLEGARQDDARLRDMIVAVCRSRLFRNSRTVSAPNE